MAMKDMFYNVEKLEVRTVSDGLGGYEKIFYRGITFSGLAVRKTGNEQVVGALRGKENVQYTFHAPSNFPIDKDDIIAFVEPGATKERFIRISSSAIVNPTKSGQTDWKSYDAEEFVTDKQILPR